MKRTLLTTLTVLVAFVALVTIADRRGSAAHAVYSHETQVSDFLEPQKDEIREEFHQSYPLSATGRINVENLNGGVRIAVWDQETVKVDAVKRAYRKDRLDEAKIDVSASPDIIRIKTEYPDRDQNFTSDEGRRYNNPATVDYSITIPRKAKIESVEVINGSLDIVGAEGDVKASSINGHLKASALMGEVRLSTVNGPLEATFSRLDEAKPISLNSVNGSVSIIIPSDANAQLRAGTVHGGITNDFGLPVIDGEYVGHELSGQLGAGGTRIKLSNVNGRIRITHADDGRTISSATSLISKTKDKSGKKQGEMEDAVGEIARAASEIVKTQNEVQREVERALRESQREMERAQQQIQREVQRDLQRQMREQKVKVRESVANAIERDSNRFADRESKSFPANGTPTVTIGTYDGSVIVRAWDKAEVMYTATKRADSDEDLKSISIESSQQGSSISIVAKAHDDEGSTGFEVYVPRTANLHISSGDGHLSVQGVAGELVAHTGDGSIEIEGANGRLDANTGDGRIRISNSQGAVEARTGDGSITLEGNFTAVQARTGDGSIVLGVPSSANFVIETDADEVSNEGLSVTSETPSSPRLKRWKIGRGGPVFTLRTGDGNVILRVR